MRRSLEVSANDSRRLDFRMHQEIKELVTKVVREEKSSRKKPSLSRMVTWILAATATAIEDMQKPKVPPK
jgi:hypothetical protein